MRAEISVAAAVLIVLLAVGCGKKSNHDGERQQAGHADTTEGRIDSVQSSAHVYVCPMHPEEDSVVPAKCPKCGMDMVRQAEGEKSSERQQ